VSFCARCGLPLKAELVVDNDQQIKQEKRALKRTMIEVTLMMVTAFNLLIFLIVYGATTLPHLTNRGFLWMWLSFVAASLATGALGAVNLV